MSQFASSLSELGLTKQMLPAGALHRTVSLFTIRPHRSGDLSPGGKGGSAPRNSDSLCLENLSIDSDHDVVCSLAHLYPGHLCYHQTILQLSLAAWRVKLC